MASFLDKVKVNSALTERTKFDLGSQHITTADFMQFQPVFVREMSPTEKIDLNVEAFSRANAMPVPSFGRANLKLSAMFVPMRTIFAGWNDFITDSYHIGSGGIDDADSVPSVVHSFNINELLRAFINAGLYSESVDMSDSDSVLAAMVSESFTFNPVPSTSNPVPDFLVSDGNSNVPYFLTNRGRQALKIVESLGYKVYFGFDNKTQYYSALPLLAAARCYLDWYVPAQYAHSDDYDFLLSLCRYDVLGGSLSLNATDIFRILSYILYVSYDSDYFVSAFDSPVGPFFGNYSNFVVRDSTIVDSNNQPYAFGSFVDNDGFGGTPKAQFVSTFDGFSQFTVDSLKALTDYVNRNRLAGSKAYQRYLARFGKSLPSDKLNQSIYLGTSLQPLQIGDVTSQSDTDGANLGAFAGRGLIYGNNHFEYETDEYGFFMVFASIVPSVGYPQGVNRVNMHRFKTDFFTPEFELKLGVQAVSASELYMPSVVSFTDRDWSDIFEKVFGFLPRYAELKTGRDYVTGNFRLNSLNGVYGDENVVFNAANSWYLMRMFSDEDFPAGAEDVVHSLQFVRGLDANQYKRIFYNVAADAPDNFTIIYNFECVSYAPMHSLFDTYDFDDKGKPVTLDVNGVKVN